MTQELLKKAFEKAETVTASDSVNARAVHLAEVVSEDFNYSITSKSMSRYFCGETTPKKEVLDALAKYLQYEDYEDFVVQESEETPSSLRPSPTSQKPNAQKVFRKKIVQRKRPVLIILAVLLLGSTSYYAFVKNAKECVVWVGDHYEEVACSGDELEKPYNKQLLEEFRKVQVNDTTTFFKYGKPVIWYDKSNKRLEYFTAPGLHPTNGKTLKPISEYMINKYVKR